MCARRALIAFLALLTVTMLHAQQADPVIDWIRSHAVPLKTPEAGNGFEDMRPLLPLIGQARIVSLGEATHGSREFFQLKHRMLEFLASEMGFSIFSIEATWRIVTKLPIRDLIYGVPRDRPENDSST